MESGSEKKRKIHDLEIHHSLWDGLYRYDIHIMSEQPPPREDRWDRWFIVYKMLLGIWEKEHIDSISHFHKPIIMKIKEEFNL